MKEIGAYEAKTKLPALLRYIQDSGEEVLITRRGVSIARMVPAYKKTDMQDIAAKLRALRKGNRLRGLSIRKLIDEGRR